MYKRMTPLLGALALQCLTTGIAQADSSKAHCEFYHKGEHKHGASGECLFSQRQGYIDIRLHNGKSFSLSPADKANHYRDQDGHKVRRKFDGEVQIYKWEERAIHVDFNRHHHHG